MRVSLIVAASENWVIGHQGALPWRLSTDLRRFKRVTMGHVLIMGRKTFESVGRALPGRRTVVVTRRRDYRPSDVLIANDLPEALATASGEEEVFVAGGGEIYRQALPLVDRIYLTRVHAWTEGDTLFPAIDERWRPVIHADYSPRQGDDFPHSFQVLERFTAD